MVQLSPRIALILLGGLTVEVSASISEEAYILASRGNGLMLPPAHVTPAPPLYLYKASKLECCKTGSEVVAWTQVLSENYQQVFLCMRIFGGHVYGVDTNKKIWRTKLATLSGASTWELLDDKVGATSIAVAGNVLYAVGSGSKLYRRTFNTMSPCSKEKWVWLGEAVVSSIAISGDKMIGVIGSQILYQHLDKLHEVPWHSSPGMPSGLQPKDSWGGAGIHDLAAHQDHLYAIGGGTIYRSDKKISAFDGEKASINWMRVSPMVRDGEDRYASLTFVQSHAAEETWKTLYHECKAATPGIPTNTHTDSGHHGCKTFYEGHTHSNTTYNCCSTSSCHAYCTSKYNTSVDTEICTSGCDYMNMAVLCCAGTAVKDGRSLCEGATGAAAGELPQAPTGKGGQNVGVAAAAQSMTTLSLMALALIAGRLPHLLSI